VTRIATGENRRDSAPDRASPAPGTLCVSDTYFKSQLEARRRHLLHASADGGQARARLRWLLEEVDAALARLGDGTFGICETCLEPIEVDRLVHDPLVRICGDHPPEAETHRLARDLALARAVQRRLLPPPQAVIDGWTFYYRYAAAGHVGGDYVDVIEETRGGEPLVLLGDVAGKGFAASMLVSQLHAMFRSLSPHCGDTTELLARANDLFSSSAAGAVYATVLVAALGTDRTISLYSAGHWPPFVRRGSRVEAVPLEGGLPLGMFPSSQYAPTRVSLDDGDTLLFFTDGASEARDAAGQEFGRDRLASVMAAAPSTAPFDIVESCFESLRRFEDGVPAQDDLTLASVAVASNAAVS
jgi:phosphoserine phosphatase RsbU/P